MFKLTITLDPELVKRFDRLMDYLEGKEQERLNQLAAKLQSSSDALEEAVKKEKE